MNPGEPLHLADSNQDVRVLEQPDGLEPREPREQLERPLDGRVPLNLQELDATAT